MIAYGDVFDQVWVALDADATVTSLMARGTKFRWTGGLLKRLEIEPAMCPVLSLGPAGAFTLPIDHHQPAPTLPLVCEIATRGQDCRDGLTLLGAVARALIAGATVDRFGDPTFDHIEFSGAEMHPLPGKDAANPLWIATFAVTLMWRRGTTI